MPDKPNPPKGTPVDIPTREAIEMILLLQGILLIRVVFWPIRRLAYCWGFIKGMADILRSNFWDWWYSR